MATLDPNLWPSDWGRVLDGRPISLVDYPYPATNEKARTVATRFRFKSNTELASAAGIHLTMASRLRSGKRKASLAMAVRILDVLRLTDREYKEGVCAMALGGDAQAEFFDRYVERYVPPAPIAR